MEEALLFALCRQLPFVSSATVKSTLEVFPEISEVLPHWHRFSQ